LPLRWLLSATVDVTLRVTVFVWLDSLALVPITRRVMSTVAYPPVTSSPDSVVVLLSTSAVVEFVVSVWFVSVAQVVVVLELESESVKLPRTELPLRWPLSLEAPPTEYQPRMDTNAHGYRNPNPCLIRANLWPTIVLQWRPARRRRPW
jgi:hypothetical protein